MGYNTALATMTSKTPTTVVRRSSEKGAIFFFLSQLLILRYIMTVVRKRKEFEVHMAMGNIGILKKNLKKWIFPFLPTARSAVGLGIT
jgi:hypothetical protein